MDSGAQVVKVRNFQPSNSTSSPRARMKRLTLANLCAAISGGKVLLCWTVSITRSLEDEQSAKNSKTTKSLT